MFKEGYYESLGYDLYYKLNDYRKKYSSLASVSQISLLMGLIANYRFKNGRKIEKVLEIGIFNGVTSLYMLKAGCKNSDNYEQYAIDIETSDFYGEAVIKEASERELQSFYLNKGKTALNISEILDKNEKLDLVFIDGGHSHPHPLIDLVSLIPYLHEESIICLHDVVIYMRPNAWGESFIYEIWPDEKYRNVNVSGNKEVLGVLKLPAKKEVLYKILLDLAKLPFRAAPWMFDEKYLGIDENSLERLYINMQAYYEEDFVEKFISYLKENLEKYKEEYILRIHETRFYNHLYTQVSMLQQEVKELKMQTNILKYGSNIINILQKNKNKKILFWGESLFLKKIFEENDLSKYDIVGVVDKNAYKKKPFGDYELYTPDQIKDLDVDIIISSVVNSHEEVYHQIQRYLLENKLAVELAEDIFAKQY